MRWLGAGLGRKALYTVPALLCLLLFVVATPVQMVLPNLPLLRVKPDLPALLIAYAAFRLPIIVSFGLAAAAGFWRDLLTAGPIGPSVFAFTLAAILVFLLRESLSWRSLPFFPPLAGLATFAVLASSHAVRLLELRHWGGIAAAWGEFGIASALTAVISFPVGWAFDWSFRLLQAKAPEEQEEDLVEIEWL
ncbi:membrane protein of unknown function [Methylacidimicrobium sp. AP8]|uniref:rod shape-determining protein MreD n=1 Tax=Methylacidimicrobium sp. AP8 TaxID=2730359 RepID=UPI0018C1B365|nr:rod shape-determining protein MreD [Methylacidimicrobium sp. AP8]CAB4244203.1 membrane protein of unknown function [Methylacidimicrobium sp. AP8]